MPDALRVRALQLLARREHGRAELARKLAPHAASAEDVDRLLDDLTRGGQLSDARYAELRVQLRGRRYGNARLAQELRQAGVADETLTAALAAGADETGRCQAVWQKKFGVLPASPGERARQQRFLQSRGFALDAIRRVLQGLDEDAFHE